MTPVPTPVLDPVLAYATDTVCLYTGDALDTLATLATGSVDCVVTSPPYWGLRDYGTGHWVGGDPDCAHSVGRGTNTPHTTGAPTGHVVGYPASAAHRGGDPQTCCRCGATRVDRQYGLEPTPQDYVDNLRALFAELRRVLAPTGTVWLNLGDSYSAEPPGRGTHAMRHSTLAGTAAAGVLREQVRSAGVDRTRSVPRKNLLGMPWRVALALQADGWVLRNAVVWAKRNPMPESVRDRLSATYEFVFLLTANTSYHFDLDAIRVPLLRPEALDEGITVGGSHVVEGAVLGASARRRGRSVYGATSGDPASFPRGPRGAEMRPTGRRHDRTHPRGKNPGDVWHLSTRPQRRGHGRGEPHFAAFPIDIPLRCIAAGCPEDGVVLDPFSGTATTGLAALQLGRRYLGIELNPSYNRLAAARLADHPRPGTSDRSEPSS